MRSRWHTALLAICALLMVSCSAPEPSDTSSEGSATLDDPTPEVTTTAEADYDRTATVCRLLAASDVGFGLYEVKGFESRLEEDDDWAQGTRFGYIELQLVEKLTDDAPRTVTLRTVVDSLPVWDVSARPGEILLPILYQVDRHHGFPTTYTHTVFRLDGDTLVPDWPIIVPASGIEVDDFVALIDLVRRGQTDDSTCPVRPASESESNRSWLDPADSLEGR